MVDIDHFKSVNDTYGHDVGDQVLKELSARLQEIVRGQDLAARLGGEEFLIVVTKATEDNAQLVAERIREDIAGVPMTATTPSGIWILQSALVWRCAKARPKRRMNS